jgi:glycosyltransferase involved in cell wall biosynthesis
MKKISVVIPCRNEEDNVEPLYADISKVFLEQLSQYDYEVIFSDNCSTDATRSILRKICLSDKKVKAIFNARNFPRGSVLNAILNASGDCVFSMPADFQVPVEMIWKSVQEWEKGHKIVALIKKSSKENKLIFFLRVLFYKTWKFMAKMEKIEIIENYIGQGLFDRSFVEILRNIKQHGISFRRIVAELGYQRKDLYFIQPRRRKGKTNYNLYDLYDIAMGSFVSNTKIGLRIFSFLGFLIAFFSLIVAIYYLVQKITHLGNFSWGVIPILVGVYFLSGMILVSIGVLGEYILSINQKLIDMNRPLVIEEERINF